MASGKAVSTTSSSATNWARRPKDMSSDKTENSTEKSLKRFEGKVSLITGAAGDLGSTTARLFSEEGARLVLFDLPSTEPKLKQLVTELLSLGSPAVIYVCGDVTNVEDVKKSVQRSVDELGEIDILFNNAGIFPIAPLQQTDEAMFKRVQDINVYGVFLMMKYASNQMIESGKGGVIINMSSYAGLMAFDAAFAYCASKFAVSGMTRAAAKSLAKHNIRVCALGPYALEGSMTDQGIEAMAKAAGWLCGVCSHVHICMQWRSQEKNFTEAKFIH